MKQGIVALLLVGTSALAATEPQLKAELLAMEQKDQAFRNEHIKQPTPEIVRQMTELDGRHTDALKAIIAKHGWPTTELVDVEGVQAAFILLQHSPDNEFQANLLPRLEAAFKAGDGISGQEVALLTDRVLVRSGKPQRYGTQADARDNQIIIKPLEDAARVDELRAEMQLPPLALYIKLLEKAYGFKDHPEIELDN